MVNISAVHSINVFFSFQHPLRPNVTTTLRNLEETVFLIYAKGNVYATTNAVYIYEIKKVSRVDNEL